MSKEMPDNTEGPWVKHRLEMLQSDAFKFLGKVEMKILARIEIEHMRHAGKTNGHLI
jgi:hypothetical protein